MKRLGWGLIVGGALLAGASLWMALAGDASTSGSAVAVEQALRQGASSAARTPPTGLPRPTAEAEPDDPDPAEITAVAPTPIEIPEPVGLRIGTIGIDAPVDPYGVDAATSQMDVPDNVTDVAWYRFGPSPGEAGSAVLAAHVDLAGQGPGVFFDLRKLEKGDSVVITYTDRSERSFRVIARTVYAKDELPTDVLFAKEGPPVLTLITCGGAFSRSDRSYDSNVVVYAVPAGVPSARFASSDDPGGISGGFAPGHRG